MRPSERQTIEDAFKNNKEFVLELISDISNSGNKDFDMISKISRAYKEYSEDLPISKETDELILNNKDVFLKKIADIKNRQKNIQNQNANQPSQIIPIQQSTPQNANNQNINSTSQSQNTNQQTNSQQQTQSTNTPSVNRNTNSPNQSKNTSTTDDYYDFYKGHTYSSTYANRELMNQINNLDNAINQMKEQIYGSKELSSKSEFMELQQLQSAKKALEDKYNKTNDLKNNYSNNNGLIRRDNKINKYQGLINSAEKKLKTNQHKFVKIAIEKYIERLKDKQGILKNKQKAIIDSSILKLYNKSRRDNKSTNKSKALTEYYNLKNTLLKIKKQENLAEIDSNSKNVITNIKNTYYKFRNVPTDLQLNYIKMRKKQIKQQKNKFSSKTIVQWFKQKNNSQGKAMGAA